MAVFFYYLELTWAGVPPPLSCEACYAFAAVASLPLSKHTAGEVLPLLPSPAGFFIPSSVGLAPPPLSGARAPHPLC
jgi:hypothetical protein